MATVNPRINITVPADVAIVLQRSAKQNRKSVSKVALDLIERAIEEREDRYFSQIADGIEQSNPKWVKDSDKI